VGRKRAKLRSGGTTVANEERNRRGNETRSEGSAEVLNHASKWNVLKEWGGDKIALSLKKVKGGLGECWRVRGASELL